MVVDVSVIKGNADFKDVLMKIAEAEAEIKKSHFDIVVNVKVEF